MMQFRPMSPNTEIRALERTFAPEQKKRHQGPAVALDDALDAKIKDLRKRIQERAEAKRAPSDSAAVTKYAEHKLGFLSDSKAPALDKTDPQVVKQRIQSSTFLVALSLPSLVLLQCAWKQLAQSWQ